MKALVLLAHGSREAGGPRPLAALCGWVQPLAPEARVVDAYLTLNQPDLGSCLTDLARQGFTEAAVVPLFVSKGHHLNVELPLLLAHWQGELPSLRLSLAPHLGADGAIAKLVLRRACQAIPLAGSEAGTMQGGTGRLTAIMIK
jgi:sirohydrochlorin cobaltochelatase